MGRNVVLGVCGSIAAYKSAEIVRELRKNGWTVKVVMTAAARQFITPLTLSTLSGNPVYCEMFSPDAHSRPREDHIALCEFADVILVAPATASIIGKAACGICDDLLTCTILASGCGVVFAPAMNDRMWKNGIVRANVEKLEESGCLFVGPEEGELASGKTGTGRLAATGKIVAAAESMADSHKGRDKKKC